MAHVDNRDIRQLKEAIQMLSDRMQQTVEIFDGRRAETVRLVEESTKAVHGPTVSIIE